MDYLLAIRNAQNLPTKGEKVDYLLATGELFVHLREYPQARNVAEYIIEELKEDSIEAERLYVLSCICSNLIPEKIEK